MGCVGMFALISGAYEAWAKKRIYNVLILGLDGAGKTVKKIIKGEFIQRTFTLY